MLSAVAAAGAFLFMLHPWRVTAAVSVDFLQRLLHDAASPVFLVLDGHSIHTATCVQDFVSAQGGRLKLFFLTLYSHHLNPDEQVWGNVKARVAKQTVTDKHDLPAKLTAALERLRPMPKIIVGLFRHPLCAYMLHAEASA